MLVNRQGMKSILDLWMQIGVVKTICAIQFRKINLVICRKAQGPDSIENTNDFQADMSGQTFNEGGTLGLAPWGLLDRSLRKLLLVCSIHLPKITHLAVCAEPNTAYKAGQSTSCIGTSREAEHIDLITGIVVVDLGMLANI